MPVLNSTAQHGKANVAMNDFEVLTFPTLVITGKVLHQSQSLPSLVHELVQILLFSAICAYSCNKYGHPFEYNIACSPGSYKWINTRYKTQNKDA